MLIHISNKQISKLCVTVFKFCVICLLYIVYCLHVQKSIYWIHSSSVRYTEQNSFFFRILYYDYFCSVLLSNTFLTTLKHIFDWHSICKTNQVVKSWAWSYLWYSFTFFFLFVESIIIGPHCLLTLDDLYHPFSV